MLRQAAPSGPMREAIPEVRRLIGRFDAKPFVLNCTHEGCGRRATRCTVYAQSVSPAFWCDQCNEHSMGANPGKLQVIRTYGDAVGHVGSYGLGKAHLKILIRDLARAKGLPSRVSEAQAQAFFAT